MSLAIAVPLADQPTFDLNTAWNNMVAQIQMLNAQNDEHLGLEPIKAYWHYDPTSEVDVSGTVMFPADRFSQAKRYNVFVCSERTAGRPASGSSYRGFWYVAFLAS